MPRDHTHTVHEESDDGRAMGDLARMVTEGLGASRAAVVAASVGPVGARAIAVGAAGMLDETAPATMETIFDLASITKSFTALAAARLTRRGVLRLSTPLGDLVDEARGTPSEHVPLELLLAHRAGLDAHRPLFAPLLEGRSVDPGQALHEAALARRPDAMGPPPAEGFAPVYSDLGYLLVGEALARAAGTTLDAVIRAEVSLPVGARAMSGRALHDDGLLANVAPTEDVPFRQGVIRGFVHDENAWAIGGGEVCGHAGLFGTAGDVLALGMALLDALEGSRDGWLTPQELAPLLRARPGGTLRAGFDGKSGEGSSAGTLFGARTFGHLGFTGTSLWIDPDAKLVGVLLTNRVHPSRASDAIRRARPAVYDGIFRWGTAKPR